MEISSSAESYKHSFSAAWMNMVCEWITKVVVMDLIWFSKPQIPGSVGVTLWRKPCWTKQAWLLSVSVRSNSHLVIHAVEQSRHHREDGRPQGLHVVWEEADVALVEADPSSMTVHHRLQTHTHNTRGGIKPIRHSEVVEIHITTNNWWELEINVY